MTTSFEEELGKALMEAERGREKVKEVNPFSMSNKKWKKRKSRIKMQKLSRKGNRK